MSEVPKKGGEIASRLAYPQFIGENVTVETEKSLRIPTEEVQKDLHDTEAEIALYEAELAAFELVPYGSPDYRMAQFKASHRRQGINDRRVFADKLRALLAARAVPATGTPEGNRGQ
jgi:hypothetical protein